LSALDTKTEAQILENLETLKKGKTTIIVSHRASSVKAADHIIVLNQGEIMEQGTHRELIAKNGMYKEIFDKQTKDE
jgi:ABC-type multidrug transport system fused ATPase/permease subunit